ncbi:MAG: NUDIX hydrolase [Chloroflexota bacterium]
MREDAVIRPDGSPGIYGVVDMKGWAIAAVPLTAEGDTLLVGQHRYTLDFYSWEVPMGGGDKALLPLDGARRELREETGIQAARWTYLGESHLSNSVCTEIGLVYLAEDLTFGEAEPEATEDLRLWRLPFSDALEMAMTGQITDALSIVALARIDLFLRDGRRLSPALHVETGVGALAQRGVPGDR